MSKLLPVMVIILAGAFAILYFALNETDSGQVISKIIKTEVSRSDSNQSETRVWKDTPQEREVEVTHEKTGAAQSITLNKYIDPNYDMRVTYPEGYNYDVKNSAVVFTDPDMNLFFSAEVLYTAKNTGSLNNFEEVKLSYMDQLEDYDVSLISSSVSTVDGKEILDYSLRYRLPLKGYYVNRFIVGQDDRFFYVLQLNSRAVEYENNVELIDEIISDFEFGAD